MQAQQKVVDKDELEAPWRTDPRTRELLIKRINRSSGQLTIDSNKRALNDEAIAE